VLGRGLETAVLHWVLRHAAGRNWKTVKGHIIETERNTPVRGVFSEAGFETGDDAGEWWAATDEPPPLPTWLTVIDRLCAPSHLGADFHGADFHGDKAALPATVAIERRAQAPDELPASINQVEDGSPVAAVVRQVLSLPPGADLRQAGLGQTPGWDSLKHIELLVKLESALGIRFASGEMETIHRLAELDSLCRRKIAARAAR